jgi:hypothetical protein
VSWAPPDRALLADLDERRAWLSRVEIVYALPRSGLLALMPDDVKVALSADRLVATSAGRRRERPLGAAESTAAESAWRALWLAPEPADNDGDGRVVLLHHHGLFGVRRSALALELLDEALAPLLGA